MYVRPHLPKYVYIYYIYSVCVACAESAVYETVAMYNIIIVCTCTCIRGNTCAYSTLYIHGG